MRLHIAALSFMPPNTDGRLSDRVLARARFLIRCALRSPAPGGSRASLAVVGTECHSRDATNEMTIKAKDHDDRPLRGDPTKWNKFAQVGAFVLGLVIGVVVAGFSGPSSMVAAALGVGCFALVPVNLFPAVFNPSGASVMRRFWSLVSALIFLYLGLYWLTNGI